nr:PREDICTED: zinc finger protein 518A isoform X1 [Lepisosteus oculatus]XP_015202182.1 PREDICTED: zinc finger protein 518A isoform X1 [Lepisosteus oculatus]XP_015202183.1 PREDICTED: zinc finger protein 518A isoform X1 [Lepisosteus oculatus]XP_015202184.1 PREDICTED: zinc finger protein 518A isoform X1 [Lepisosteus oculatus]XP_015202185.1 PREDICTED: zinc finger protein 518A isoform X1 [Lepisosteus oculatus]
MEPGHKTPDDPPESVENGKRDEKKWDISQLQPSAFPTNVQRMEFGLKDLSVVLPVTHNLHQYVSQQIRETLAKPKMQTARKSFKKKPFKESQGTESSGACYQFRQSPQDGVKISGKILRFSCSECKGEAAFSPNDLLKHFQVAHQGCLPTYPCDMCNFTANDFPVLQQHRLGHRDTYVKCEICNDNVQYSLLQLTRHFSSYHSSNGHYRCEKCKFSTKDVGTFVQHIHRHSEVQYKCGKCQHVSYTKGEFQRHLLVHTGTFPFQCQFCDYGATRKDYVLKHMNAVHSDEIERKCKLKDKEDGAKTLADAKSGLKLLLKRNTAGVARDAQWRTAGFHALSGGGLLDEYGRLANPEKTLEETQQFLERTVASEKDCIQWAKARKSEQQYLSPSTPAVLKPKMESCLGSNSGFLKTGGSGSSVLMVKNKISIPPNCTTKFMGFKMVDGKRHLVLKVIPAAKLGSSPQTVAPSVEKDAKGRGPEKGMNGPICVEDVALQCSSLPVSSHSSLSQSTLPACSDSQSSINKGSSVVKELLQAENQESSSTSHTVVNDGHPISDDEQKPSSSASPTTCKVFHTTSQKAQIAHPSKAEMDQQSEHTSLVEFASNKTSPEMDKESLSSKETLLESIVVDNENNSDLNSSRQEVFSFHNYSKDRASSESSDTVKESGDQEASQLMTDVCVKDSFQSQCAKDLTGTSLTLADVLSPHSQDCKVDEEMGEIIADQLSSQGVMEKVPDSEIEVDECIATVEEDSAEPSDVLEEPEDSLFMPKITSVFSLQSEENGPQLDVNQLLEKVLETENKKASILSAQEKKELKVAAGESTVGNPCSATALGRILEEHSDAIISQQLEKERISSANQDPVKNSAATLRILQPINVTEGKKQVFLKPCQNGFALPIQVGSNQGFQLITGSSHPQINVSYLNTGKERPKKPPGLTFTLNNGRIGTTAQIVGDKKVSGGAGNGEESAVLCCGSSTGHYIVNNMPLKGSLILSNSVQSLSGERTSNLPTCFLVQRQLPMVTSTSCQSGVTVSHNIQGQPQRPVLAVPINSPEKPAVVQAGRQAFLLKCVTPVKQGTLLNSQIEAKVLNQNCTSNESGGNKVLLKIVRNASGSSFPSSTGELNGIQTLAMTNQPVYLTTGALQSSCISRSSNQSIVNVSTGYKTSGPSQDSSNEPLTVSQLLNCSSPAAVQGKSKEKESGVNSHGKIKRVCLPSPKQNHLAIRKKRQRGLLLEESSGPSPKAKKPLSKKWKETEKGPADAHELCATPVPKDVERTLRLSPFSATQRIKCPRRNQPVVVLNHPDADVPEVVNVMKTINKFKGHVLKVALSQRTIDALSELNCDPLNENPSLNIHATRSRRAKPVSPVKERYILKLRLKKTSRNKYKVVKSTSDSTEKPTFSCWFCGRIFDNQEEWIGHGQRHLMEATRDWNKLF